MHGQGFVSYLSAPMLYPRTHPSEGPSSKQQHHFSMLALRLHHMQIELSLATLIVGTVFVHIFRISSF